MDSTPNLPTCTKLAQTPASASAEDLALIERLRQTGIIIHVTEDTGAFGYTGCEADYHPTFMGAVHAASKSNAIRWDTENANKPMKLVEIRLAALTRVEYTEVIQVPANITADELNTIVNRRYETVSGDEFTPDPEFWERGTCYATDSDLPNAVATLVATRTDGMIDIEPVRLNSYYVWCDDDCQNKTDSLAEAKEWRDKFIAEGRAAWIVDAGNNYITDGEVATAEQPQR